VKRILSHPYANRNTDWTIHQTPRRHEWGISCFFGIALVVSPRQQDSYVRVRYSTSGFNVKSRVTVYLFNRPLRLVAARRDDVNKLYVLRTERELRGENETSERFDKNRRGRRYRFYARARIERSIRLLLPARE